MLTGLATHPESAGNLQLFGGQADGAEGQCESGGIDDGGQIAIFMDLEATERRQPGLRLQQQAEVEGIQEAAIAAQAFFLAVEDGDRVGADEVVVQDIYVSIVVVCQG